jgi:hypothetical protein
MMSMQVYLQGKAATQLLPRQLFATVVLMNHLLAKEKLRTYNSSQEAGQLLVAFVRPQLFFCKRVHWSKSKVEPAANTVDIVAFEIYLASAAVS